MSELCATTTYESECISIERMSVTTTSPIYDEIPQFPREERHHYHSSDSTICEFEGIHLEGVSEPPHIMSEEVDWSCEATIFSNNLTSTSIVSSPLVLGLLYDDAPIFDEYPPHMEEMMAMEENDAPSTWFHQDDDVDQKLVLSTSPTLFERHDHDNIGDGTTLVPLVDFDCLHDDDLRIAMPHACVPTTCFDGPPIYDTYDDEHVEYISYDAMLHRISFPNYLGHIMFDTLLDLSYIMHEITHIASLQSHHNTYVIPININPICAYGIDDKSIVIGICFSSDDIDMLPLQNLCHSSLRLCHEPSLVSHDSISCVHILHPMNNNASHVLDAHTCLRLHYAINRHNPLMMDDMFLYHASHFFEHWISCANHYMHVHIMMDDVYIYHARTLFLLSQCC